MPVPPLRSLVAIAYAFSSPLAASATEPLHMVRSEVTKKPPTLELKGVARIWVLEKAAELGARLIQLRGTLPLHVHPDSTERVFVIEGELSVTLDGAEVRAKPGDYFQIPPGVRHRVALAPGTRLALVGSTDVPLADATKTIWVEPAPAAVRGAPQP